MLLITKCENYENCWSLEEEAESKESGNNPLLETCLHSEGNHDHDDYYDMVIMIMMTMLITSLHPEDYEEKHNE